MEGPSTVQIHVFEPVKAIGCDRGTIDPGVRFAACCARPSLKVRAEPAIKEGFSRTRSPFCSRYRLNPRLCSSLPVFHDRRTLSAVALAVNISSSTTVGKLIKVVCVAVLFDELGSGWSAVTEAC